MYFYALSSDYSHFLAFPMLHFLMKVCHKKSSQCVFSPDPLVASAFLWGTYLGGSITSPLIQCLRDTLKTRGINYFISCYWAWEDILRVTQPFFSEGLYLPVIHFKSTFPSFHSDSHWSQLWDTVRKGGTYWSCSDCTWVKYFCTLSTSIQQFDIW